MATVTIDYPAMRRRALAPFIAARPALTEAELGQLIDDAYESGEIGVTARRVLSTWLQASIAIIEELERCEQCTPIAFRASRPRRTRKLPRRASRKTLTPYTERESK